MTGVQTCALPISPVCPTKAIFAESDLPEKWAEYKDLNADLAGKWPNISAQKSPLPEAEEFKDKEGNVVHDPEVPTVARLDRAGLQKLATAGGGQYFELDRDGDRHIATTIIDTAKRMAPSLGAQEQAEELYWRFLVVAAIFPFIGMVFLRDRAELWIQAIGVTGAAVLVMVLLG